MSFAFPVTGAIALLVTAVVTLMRYVPGGALYIFGGALILTGGLNVLIEFLLHITFGIEGMFVWSIYPLTVCVLLGVMLLVVAVCKRRAARRTGNSSCNLSDNDKSAVKKSCPDFFDSAEIILPLTLKADYHSKVLLVFPC